MALILILALIMAAEAAGLYVFRNNGKGLQNHLRYLENLREDDPLPELDSWESVLTARRIYTVDAKQKSRPSGSGHSGSSGSGNGSQGSGEPKPEKQPYFLSAKGMLSKVNEERRKNQMNELTWDDQLEECCKTRCLELTISFSHTRPDGTPGRSVYPKWKQYPVGENISVIGYWDKNALNSFFSGFCRSQAHYFNMAQESYTHLGAAIYYASDGKVYCCMLLCNKGN